MRNNLDNSTHRVQSQLHRLLRLCINTGLLLVLIIFIFLLGPVMETKHFPVMDNVTGKFLTSVDGKMFFSMYGNKIRACTFQEIRALVDKKLDDGLPPVKGFMWYADEDASGKTRPVGYQDLGVWAIRPQGEQVTVEVSWRCHPFWNTTQTLGVWNIKEQHAN